ncbi:hypothetical protein FYJ53_20745 [Eubacterium sp. BL-380-WT-2B]|uniref:Lar family restriction alleviation protein n=1 Tax=Eubacterium sp. BL-380-WT-2B TaxID=2605785 RepID=UPI0012B41298|nr:Lar family restriction alleviation protein [Eubacterium sp. BL-380-WT-2B]MSS96184.1 hypothetical protein [Eubacterium sp. BL-380-WT-2B]
MTKKLKPCAHCGKEGHIRVRDDIWLQPANFEPHCDTYGCQGSVGLAYATEEAAIESWNTRTPEIMRCGECVWFNEKTKNIGDCGFIGDITQKNNFCSYGERREEDGKICD